MITAGDFRPSSHGFHFANYWPPGTPALTVRSPLGSIPIGSAENGLCGGMCFAALDLHTAGRQPPADRVAPAAGSPALDYLTWRLLASWNVPKGVLTFCSWANTADQDTAFGLRPGVSHRTVATLPAITAAIDRGDPVPLGLVTVRSADPRRLADCHYAVAYGYDRDATGPGAAAPITLHVYDPNSPDRDDVTISIDPGTPPDPGAARTITHTVDIPHPIRGFFPVDYRPADPSRIAGPPWPDPTGPDAPAPPDPA